MLPLRQIASTIACLAPGLLATILALATPAAAQKPAKPGEAAATAPAGPLGSAMGDVSGWRVEILGLERGGGMVTVTLSLINESGDEMPFSTGLFGEPNNNPYGNVSGIYLIDTTNRQKYLVVRDSEGDCLCSRDVPAIAAGASGMVWARFPEPPADVTTVGVVVPHFVPMDDVPLAP